MGCFGSREDARRKAFADDYQGAEFAFAVGGIKSASGFCPIDKLSLAFCGGEGKELKDGIGEFADAKVTEEMGNKLGKQIFEALEKLHGDLVKDFKDGSKAGEVMGKYTGADAISQIDSCLKVFAEKSGIEGLKWPKEAESKDAAMDMMMDAAADMEMAEGGEEGEKAAEDKPAEAMMAAAKMSLIAPDAFGDISGVTEIPKLLLSLMFLYPFFGDSVKAQVMHAELGGDGEPNSFGAVAAMVGAYVDAGEKAEADSFGCALLSGDDLEELKEVFAKKDESALVFPGVCGAWSDEADALGQAEDADGKTKVLFKFKGKVLKPAGDKLQVFCRQFAKVESLSEPADGAKHWVCVLSDFAEFVFATVGEWSEKVKALAAVVDEVKDAVEKKDDMMMMMDEAPMEMAEGADM